MLLTLTNTEAKRYVANDHNLDISQIVIQSDYSPGDPHNDFLAAIFAGSKLNAIKVLRQVRGCGLKDAKNAVDIMFEYFQRIPVQPPIDSWALYY